MNLTKEIIDETSILYREDPIYQVVDENGQLLKEDQKLWEEIMKQSRYNMFMDKLDRWTKLLGTVLVKVSFVDEDTGQLVKETEGGKVQLDMLHGGVYDMKHGASPYYITELLIGFGTKFGGFSSARGTETVGGGIARTIPSPSDLGQASIENKQHIDNPGRLGTINSIFWSPTSHYVEDNEKRMYETKNPYGLVPAIPFFNQDPAHYYFLPINEPLIYANHALNMRMTDLNHIAKFQSFGVPVISGVERPTSVRQGRPVDDFNMLKGGTAQSRFGGIGGTSGFGAGGGFRTFDSGMGIFRDGNADAAALGMSLGPDTAIAVGEKGDFKFEHPNADITGLIRVIESITDHVRINHGLRPKYKDSLPSSGFAQMLEKMGVIEDNIRRSKLFKEREQQLFQIIKRLYNTHNNKAGDRKFSEKSQLQITYVPPKFPVEPKTHIETIIMENQLLDKGDKDTYRKLYPYLGDADINQMIKDRRKDREEQELFETDLLVKKVKTLEDQNIDPMFLLGKSSKPVTEEKDSKVSGNKIDNKLKHSQDSSKQNKTDK